MTFKEISEAFTEASRVLQGSAERATERFALLAREFAGLPPEEPRRRLVHGDPIETWVATLAMGHEGARRALVGLWNQTSHAEFRALLLDLDDMNLRHRQIAVAWEFAGGDLEFRDLIYRRDPGMVDYINHTLPAYPPAYQCGGSYGI